MKFSNNYSIYPNNNALVQAIDCYRGLAGADNAKPDAGVGAADNCTHTLGNYEQRRYGASIIEHARVRFEAELTEQFHAQAPIDWAMTQNNLGNVLAALGQQHGDEALYRKAIQAITSALTILNRDSTPLAWAVAQYDLGTAAQALGKQLGNSKLLKQAADAYTNALHEWSREQMPWQWALTMYQLGGTFHAHGLLLKGNRTLQKSVVAYKNALAIFDADTAALELTATQNNRGAALHHLGESEGNSARVEEAIRAYEKALLVCQEQQLPIHLAVVSRINIATARAVLAELTQDPTIAQEAASDFELIIAIFPEACQPSRLEHCEAQLEKALAMVETLRDHDRQVSRA